MKALNKRLILRADLEQKSVLKYGSLTLFMPPNQEQLSQDGKLVNPVLAEVVAAHESYPYIKAGDIVALNHNIIGNKAFHAIDRQGSVVTLVIPIDRGVLGKLDDKGDLVPLCDNILAERIAEQPVSKIIFTPEAYRKTEPNKVKVLAVSPEVTDIEVGSTALVHKFSDYECWYTIDGVRRSAIIVWSVDVVGTEEKML